LAIITRVSVENWRNSYRFGSGYGWAEELVRRILAVPDLDRVAYGNVSPFDGIRKRYSFRNRKYTNVKKENEKRGI